jgi:signal transduction histidine kinase
MTLTATLVLPCELLAQLFLRIGEFWYWLAMLVIPTIVLVAYNLVVWRFGRGLIKRLFAYGSEKEWSLYALSAAICYLVLSSIYPRLAEYTGIVLLMIFFVFWSLIILCFAIINTHEKVRQKYEAELARDIISTGREYYGKLTDLTEQLHMMRHDYKHHLASMQRMLTCGNENEMKEYLEKLNAEIDDKGINEYCTSRAINALLSSFAERCKRESIEFSVQIILSPAGAVDDYELCIILGNLIENAITACRRTPEGERRYIELSMRPREGQYGIKVENSFDGVLKHDGKTLFTTKTEGGLGIDSIKTVAARHNGEYVPVWEGHTFSAFTVLKY